MLGTFPHSIRGPGYVRSIAGYEIRGQLGSGAFGKIFLGMNKMNEKVAIKKEQKSKGISHLSTEASVYKAIGPNQGIPELKFFLTDSDTAYLGLDLLGPNVAELMEKLGTKLSLKTVLMIADQLLTILQIIHQKNYIHCDIKPENLVIGHRKQARFIYLIDYGLARHYKDPRTHEHYPFQETHAFYGTGRYASIVAHKKMQLSRRDDLESVAYLLIFLLTNHLPWIGIKANDTETQLQKIRHMKETIPISQICENVPIEFQTFLVHVRKLGFDEDPPYAYYRAIFRNLFIQSNFVYDYLYDWMSLPSDQRKIHTKHHKEKYRSESPILDAGWSVLKNPKPLLGPFRPSSYLY